MAETTELKKSDFYFDLPQELIAQDPLEDRSSSRLLVLDKNTGEISHHIFRDIIDYLHPGDCLVLNNTKVIPARLLGEREGTGGHVEVLLLKRKEADVWETLVKPGKKCKPGQRLTFGDGLLKAEVLETVEEGNRLIRFEYEGIFEEVLDKLGEMPLPPYITHKLKDKNRYQTVYAKYEGSAAAPTAGLHFTQELLQQMDIAGCLVVADALNCQRETAKVIVSGKGDYLLSVKENQPSLMQDIRDYVQDDDLRGGMSAQSIREKNRDRIEKRTAFVMRDIEWLPQKP